VKLRGRVVLLTGASGGIGRATARLLAAEGVRLALHGRREEPLRALEAEVRALGGEALVVTGDVRSAADAARAVGATVAGYGALDALVNNAGVGMLRRVDVAADEEVAELFEANVLGTWRMTRAALPELLGRGGIVVNVASIAGRVGAPHYSFYAATKAALIALSESWRRELLPRGVRVSTVLPAAVNGEFLDRLGRAIALGTGPAGVVLEPEQVARGIASVLRRPRPEIYIPWWNRWLAVVDVTFPGLSDRIVLALYRKAGGRA
jgi:hypothetical protein